VFAVIMIGPGSDRSGDCLPLVGIGLAEFYRRAWSVSQHPRPASVVLYCEVEAMNRDCVRLFVVGIVVAEVNPNGVADFPTKDWSGNACIGSDIRVAGQWFLPVWGKGAIAYGPKAGLTGRKCIACHTVHASGDDIVEEGIGLHPVLAQLTTTC